MKKERFLALAAALGCMALTGCAESAEPAPSLAAYSFSGENEYFSIANGVLLLTPDEQILYGGDLTAAPEAFSGVVSYSATFYLAPDAEILMSNSFSDQAGGTLDISGFLGQVSGQLVPRSVDDGWAEQLCFVLQTTGRNGEENEYRLPLRVTEITGDDDP